MIRPQDIAPPNDAMRVVGVEPRRCGPRSATASCCWSALWRNPSISVMGFGFAARRS
ncbi:MAG: hypothetical protein R3C45_11045 [Phycisphaerales bacterium]